MGLYADGDRDINFPLDGQMAYVSLVGNISGCLRFKRRRSCFDATKGHAEVSMYDAFMVAEGSPFDPLGAF